MIRMSNFLKAFGFIAMLWNCRSILSNHIEFRNYVYKNEPQIIFLCETWLKFTDNLAIPGYTTYRKDRFGKGGGVAILVKNTITSTPWNNIPHYNDGQLESLVIKVKVNNKWCNMCILYNPCKNISANEFKHYFENLGQNSIICGDLNAHHPIWSKAGYSRVANITGKKLAEVMEDNINYNLLTPPGAATRLNKTYGITTTIDLMFGSGMFNNVDLTQIEKSMGSDHSPFLYIY